MTTPNHRNRTRLHLALTPPLRHFLDTLPSTDRFHAVRHINDATPLPLPSSARLHTFIHLYKLIKDEQNTPSTSPSQLPLPIPQHPKMQTRSQTANNTNTDQPPPTTPPPTSRQLPSEHNEPNPPTTSRSSHYTRQPASLPANADSAQSLTTPTPTLAPSQPSSQPHHTYPTAPQTHHQRSSSTTTTNNRRHSVPTDNHTPTFKSPENTLKHPTHHRHHTSKHTQSRSCATTSYPDITPPDELTPSTLDAILRHTPRRQSTTTHLPKQTHQPSLDFSSHHYSTPTHSPSKHYTTMAPSNPFQPDPTPATFDDIIHETPTSTISLTELRQFPTIPDNQLTERLVRNLLDRLVTLFSQDSSRDTPCREAACIRKLSSSFHWRKLATWLRSYLDKSIQLSYSRSEYWTRLYDFYHPYCFTPRPEQLDLATALSRISDRLTPDNPPPIPQNRSSRYRLQYTNPSYRPNNPYTYRPPHPSFPQSFPHYVNPNPNQSFSTPYRNSSPYPRPPFPIPIHNPQHRNPYTSYTRPPPSHTYHATQNQPYTPRPPTPQFNRTPTNSSSPRPPSFNRNPPPYNSPPSSQPHRPFRNTYTHSLDPHNPIDYSPPIEDNSLPDYPYPPSYSTYTHDPIHDIQYTPPPENHLISSTCNYPPNESAWPPFDESLATDDPDSPSQHTPPDTPSHFQ